MKDFLSVMAITIFMAAMVSISSQISMAIVPSNAEYLATVVDSFAGFALVGQAIVGVVSTFDTIITAYIKTTRSAPVARVAAGHLSRSETSQDEVSQETTKDPGMHDDANSSTMSSASTV